MAITSIDAEQKLLGLVDYWLGITSDRRGRARLRASGKYFYIDEDGGAWYVATCREIGWSLAKDKRQVQRLVDSLRAKGFLLTEPFSRRDRTKVLCLRLNWKRIENAYSKAPVSEVVRDDE